MISKTRMTIALAVAVTADLLQLPLTAAFLGSVLSVFGITLAAPVEAADLTIDVVTAFIEIWLLGFHWMLLPTALIESVPLLDLAPTWTACVWWVIRARRNAIVETPPIQTPNVR